MSKKYLSFNGLSHLWLLIKNIIPSKVSDLTNDGDGTTGSEFATKAYVDASAGAIDTIKVNGTTQTITNKAVDISVPTNNNQLVNGAGYQTATEVQNAINSAVASTYKYKGSVANYAALPSSGQAVGDVYNVETADSTHGIKAGDNVAWNGTAWDVLAGMVDLSDYLKDTDVIELTNSEIDSVCV